MQILKASSVYFALVFAAGFVLGTLRVLVIAPRIGERAAELLEMPLMVLASFVAARWTMRRFAEHSRAAVRIAIGVLALALMLAFEIAVAVLLRDQTPSEALLDRDPVAGIAYFAALGGFASMPLLVGLHLGARRPVH